MPINFSPPNVSVSSPKKLDTTYSPVGLWNFDGVLTDAGTAGDNLTVQRGSTRYGPGHVPGTQGLFVETTSTGFEGSTPAPAALRIIGSVTIQAVVYWSEFGIGSFGSEIVACKVANSNLEADNFCWTLDLQNQAGVMTPEFQWEHGGGNRVRIQAPTSFTFTTGRWYHIVARRSDKGGGQSFGEIIVNQTRIASGTDTSPTGGGNCYITIGQDDDLNVGLTKCIISSIKVVDRALTDAELAAEFDRIREVI